MDFQCFKCFQQFDDIKNIFHHLKNVHNLNKGIEKLKCIVNNSRCGKSFLNFDSLRQHAKCCLKVSKTPSREVSVSSHSVKIIAAFISFSANFQHIRYFQISNEFLAKSLEFDNSSETPVLNESSQSDYYFEYKFDQLQCDNIEPDSYEFQYDFKEKSRSHVTFGKLRSFLSSWIKEIISMKLNTKTTTKIFQLSSKLIDETSDINIELLSDLGDETETIVKQINLTKDMIHSEFSLYNNRYKFNKQLGLMSSYVHPEERAVGTRYDMKLDRNEKIAIPRLIQSTCQFIPITKTLQALFQNEEFRYVYFQYNSERHTCTEGQYKSFCCGEVCKQNELFNTDPYAVQI